MDPVPQIWAQIRTDGPMAQQEAFMDYGSVTRYVERCIRAERRMWGKALEVEIPEIKLDEIDDADIRRQVGNAHFKNNFQTHTRQTTDKNIFQKFFRFWMSHKNSVP